MASPTNEAVPDFPAPALMRGLTSLERHGVRRAYAEGVQRAWAQSIERGVGEVTVDARSARRAFVKGVLAAIAQAYGVILPAISILGIEVIHFGPMVELGVLVGMLVAGAALFGTRVLQLNRYMSSDPDALRRTSVGLTDRSDVYCHLIPIELQHVGTSPPKISAYPRIATPAIWRTMSLPERHFCGQAYLKFVNRGGAVSPVDGNMVDVFMLRRAYFWGTNVTAALASVVPAMGIAYGSGDAFAGDRSAIIATCVCVVLIGWIWSAAFMRRRRVAKFFVEQGLWRR